MNIEQLCYPSQSFLKSPLESDMPAGVAGHVDHWRAKEVIQGDPGEVGKRHIVPGLLGHKRSLHLVPRAVGSLMEL